MILNTAPANEAVLSNVGEIGEFRIRNSAKAFNILSSGLYANKIRAIVRELSCNAIDAHKAANTMHLEYEVHLPTAFEPWFAIRDFGTGLSHDQVKNIYTTYFESTKTDSNAFIGALGLGSKSPFSYTDNFTVTAIKDGHKGIYTAFINDSGVPSIALMAEESTSDLHSGVEIKFSVNERGDYEKFRQEADYVYRYFEKVPKITGNKFTVTKLEYESRDIIPGVHSYKRTGYGSNVSRAIMGNIAYPIDVPNAQKNLGTLTSLLECGLEIHFGIGELDFQASREGLSYIQTTIDSIKNKLETLNASLTDVLAKEANSITCLWTRSKFLYSKRSSALWRNAVRKYAADTKFALFDLDASDWSNSHTLEMTTDDIAKKYNITIGAFHISKSVKNNCKTIAPDRRHSVNLNAQGIRDYENYWRFNIDTMQDFIKSDTKVGSLERSKHHYRARTWLKDEHSKSVFVLSAADKIKPAKFDEFLRDIHNPPSTQITFASTLSEKPRAASGVGKNVTIMRIEKKTRTRSWRDEKYLAWVSAGTLDQFDDKKTYYYAPLSAYTFTSKVTGVQQDLPQIYQLMLDSGVAGLNDIVVHGVRKGDMDAILAKKNWINIEDHLTATLKTVDQQTILGIVKSTVDSVDFMRYNGNFYNSLKPTNEIAVLKEKFSKVKDVKVDKRALEILSRTYAKNNPFDASVLIDTYRNITDGIYKKYPLLTYLYNAKTADIAEYINLMDDKHGY